MYHRYKTHNKRKSAHTFCHDNILDYISSKNTLRCYKQISLYVCGLSHQRGNAVFLIYFVFVCVCFFRIFDMDLLLWMTLLLPYYCEMIQVRSLSLHIFSHETFKPTQTTLDVSELLVICLRWCCYGWHCDIGFFCNKKWKIVFFSCLHL